MFQYVLHDINKHISWVIAGLVMGIAFCLFQCMSTELEHYITQYEIATFAAYENGVMAGQKLAIRAGRANVDALTILFSRYTTRDFAKHLAELVIKYSAKYGVPSVILAGMVMQESSCNPKRVSSANAKGLTQVIWKYWGPFLIKNKIATKESDLFIPEVSIEAGAAILAYLLQKYNYDLEKAMEHYSGSAKRYLDKVIGRVVFA